MDEIIKKLENEISKAKLKIILSGVCEAILIVVELEIMINYKSNFLALAIIVLLMVVALFFLINGILDVTMLNKEIDAKKYEDIYNAQKASYLIIKKSFDEMDARLKNIEENSALPAEEIITAQKAVAKVTISRSKENTDALMNSNDELINHLFSMEEKIDGGNSELLIKQQQLISETKADLQNKISDLRVQIAAIEGKISNVGAIPVMQAAPTMAMPVEPVISQPSMEMEEPAESVEEVPESDDLGLDLDLPIEEEPLEEETVEEPVDDLGLDIDLPVEEEALQEEEPMAEEEPEPESEPIPEPEPASEPEPIAEEPVIEAPAEPEIAEEPEPIVEEPAVEEPAPEPEPESEPIPEPEPVPEPESEPVVEQKPIEIPDVGIDLSDPNRVMSPEEIEKLFASI